MAKIRAAILGGSGYGGSELIRILLRHPDVEITFVTANEHAGKPVAEVHRNLLGATGLSFSSAPAELGTLSDVDVAFFALPHGQAAKLIPTLPESVRAIDLSGDFRIDDPGAFSDYYGFAHPGEIQGQFVYGLSETNRDAVRTARFVANPGCFATATLLALAPLVDGGVLSGKVVVDAKTGSSGSGAKPAPNTHHPQRMTSFYAYKPFEHQHVPEIEQHLRSIGPFDNEFVFMTHSLPVARGIFASCYLELSTAMSKEALVAVFHDFYSGSPFIRVVDRSPDINWVKTTNFCDIAVNLRGRHAVVFSAIDNLVKGAAGQAVQNMNLMYGLDETAGLNMLGTNP